MVLTYRLNKLKLEPETRMLDEETLPPYLGVLSITGLLVLLWVPSCESDTENSKSEAIGGLHIGIALNKRLECVRNGRMVPQRKIKMN